MKSDADIAKQFRKHKSVTDRGLSAQWENTEKVDRYYEANFFDTTKAGRRPVQIDKVSPYINAVNGFMIQVRPNVAYAARIQDEAKQEFYSKNANAIAKYLRKNAKASQIETQANKKTLMYGYSATETATTYNEGYATTDANGEVIMGDVTTDCGWDPMARQTNLLDRRWDYYRKSYSLEDAKKLFGVSDEDDFQSAPKTPDTGYEYDPDIYPYDRSKTDEGTTYDWDSKTDKTVWVYFYSWTQIEDFYRAENPLFKLTNPLALEEAIRFLEEIRVEAEDDEEMAEFDPGAERLVFTSKYKERFEEAFEDLIKIYKFQKKVYYKAVLSGDKVFTSYRAACQKAYTVQFITGTWWAKSRIWIGMINPMMEPTLFFNKALESLMYTIDANSKGGLLYEDDATDDPQRLEANYNKTDSSIKLRPGGLGKVREKRSPFQPTGYDQIISLSNQAISDTMGFDLAAILSAQDQQSGVLHRQLVKQVKSTLAAYFDAFEAYREEHARLMLDLMRVYCENNEGAVVRILGPENAAEFITISKEALFVEYDIDIVETPETDEVKTEQAQILISMGDKLAAIGDTAGKAFYAGALKVLPLDAEQRQEMLEALKSEDPRIAQAQQVIQQLQSQISQLTDQQVRALNEANLKLIQAQTSYTQSNIDKNMAGVQKTAADTVKALEESETIRIENKLAPYATMDKVSVSI